MFTFNLNLNERVAYRIYRDGDKAKYTRAETSYHIWSLLSALKPPLADLAVSQARDKKKEAPSLKG